MAMFLGGGGGGVGVVKSSATALVRHFSRKAAVNVRKINPKVPHQEAYSIAESLYGIIKLNGPLSISNTWIHAKDAGVTGLMSKTHMKIMLKWMRGRRMLKLFCNQVGSTKKFLHCTLPEQPETEQSKALLESKLRTENPPRRGKKQTK